MKLPEDPHFMQGTPFQFPIDCRQFTARASISASVYFPAPFGPARMSECGNRSARMLSRRCLTVSALP